MKVLSGSSTRKMVPKLPLPTAEVQRLVVDVLRVRERHPGVLAL